MTNSPRLLRAVVTQLESAGFAVVVFGGWAEELNGLSPPRTHHDIDLLLLDPDLAMLDAFLSTKAEAAEKRSTHKRALTVDGVLVDLFIAKSDGGAYITLFWDQLRWPWPANLTVAIAGLRVASPECLATYRSSWSTIRASGPASF
ncbi:MAG: hypothetical protein WAO09_07430 [Candidatus Dormiibacterota bacterium]|jgi:hypothetical protein